MRWYGSGAAWRGGMGTASSMVDVCDVCWGSGDANRHGEDLRALRDGEAQRVARGAAERLARAAGAPLEGTAAARTALIAELERFANGRKARPPWFAEVCLGVARAIREGLAPSPAGDLGATGVELAEGELTELRTELARARAEVTRLRADDADLRAELDRAVTGGAGAALGLKPGETPWWREPSGR